MPYLVGLTMEEAQSELSKYKDICFKFLDYDMSNKYLMHKELSGIKRVVRQKIKGDCLELLLASFMDKLV